MGLDTSHDCWSGPYSAFHRWRKDVARRVGIDLEVMEGFAGMFGQPEPVGGPRPWPEIDLVVLLRHSDCDGEIAVDDLPQIKRGLEAILPLQQANSQEQWYADATERFITGLSEAIAAGEPVEFH